MSVLSIATSQALGEVAGTQQALSQKHMLTEIETVI